MAGTLTISTLSDGTNSTSSTNCIQGSAKAWVTYNSATQTILASYNVGSITYSSAGVWTVNFTNALADANYAVASCCNSHDNAGANGALLVYATTDTSVTNKTASQLQMITGYSSNNTLVNRSFNSVICYR